MVYKITVSEEEYLMKNMTTKEKIKVLNNVLKESLLCIPPYPAITGSKVSELYDIFRQTGTDQNKNKDRLVQEIRGMIIHPWQRAYQMEYRFKKADIFTPFIPVLEYAMHDVCMGNYTGAYITLLPMVESVFREWGKQEKRLALNTMGTYYQKVDSYLRSEQFYPQQAKEKEYIAGFYIKYIVDRLKDLFEKFGDAEKLSEREWFNRNVVLHTLHDTEKQLKMREHSIQLLLLLDMIAEVYLMKSQLENVSITLDADYETNIDFNLRWQIYINLSLSQMSVNSLNIIKDSFVEKKQYFDKQKILDGMRKVNEMLCSSISRCTLEKEV